ncbi:MAG: hypothetical protein ACKVX9_18935 [Blastocatellia bacterium]
MSASQLEIILNQVRLLSPNELVRLLKMTIQMLEEKQLSEPSPRIPTQTVNYVAMIGSGKGLYSSVEEIDRFIRKERDEWEEYT